jgi:gliding motility-associated-like protein
LNITGPLTYYAEGTAGICLSIQRKKVTVAIIDLLPQPVATVDSAGSTYIKFKWNAVPNAVSYEVTIDAGANWITPSSGPTGLTHTVTGLQPLQEVTLIVRALGQVDCQTIESAPVTGKTFSDQLFIPNTFTPNGDGLNDILQVYGFTILRLKFVVFNQWGEKLNESTNPTNVWDGSYKGKPQPSGVYMYVCQVTLTNGNVITRKGSINLIR